MVRSQSKPTPEEKKETQKKKTTSKKKVETGQWPCKINGCNKVFAREADLKRHQRTTKLHSMPGFACPQCDATFTRTDALRRHQKSRHNGVIIPPTEDKGKRDVGGEAGSSGSKSPSPGGTPPRSQGDPGSAKSSPPSAVAHSGTSGTGSYYRQHTMTSNYPPRAHPAMMMDQHYPPSIGPPTSAARLHQANWHHPPWPPEAPPPGMYHMPPPPPGYYHHSPYYRPPPGMVALPPPHHYPPMHMGPEYMAHPHIAPNGMPYPPPPHGAPPYPQAEGPPSDGGSQNGRDSDADMEDGSSQASAPVIDPSLDGPAEALHPSAAQAAKGGSPAGEDEDFRSRQVAEAAVRAVLEYREAEAKRAASSRGASVAPEPKQDASEDASQSGRAAPRENGRRAMSPRQHGAAAPGSDGDADADADGEADGDGDSPRGNAVEHPVRSSEVSQLSDIVTEDGVTMLNPAELLTQESLASPPPS